MSFDAVWTVALADSDNGKVVFIGRESGVMEKYSTRHMPPDPPLLSLKPHEAAITAIVASSADDVLSCSIDQTVKQYNTAQEPPEGGKREMKKLRAGAPLRCMLLSGESTYCGAHDGNIYIFGAGEKPTVLHGHGDWVVALAVTEGSLLSASYDGTVRVWDTASGRNTYVLLGHTNQVKCVQFTGSTVFTAARDDTLRLWNLPAESAGGDAPAAPAEGDEPAASEGAKRSDSSDVTVLRSHAVVALPASPHAFCLSGSSLFIGCADSRVRSIATKDLLRAVADFVDNNTAAYRKCKSIVDSHTSILIKQRNAETKREIKKKKLELQEEAATRAREAAERARKQAQPGEGDEAEIEPPRDELEEGAEVVLPEELQTELATFVEQRKKMLNEATEKIRGEQKEKIASLAPIKAQTFFCDASKFDRMTFTRTFSECEDSVVALQVDQSSAYVAVGSTVSCTPCRPGITAL